MTRRNWGDLFESGPVLIREIFKSELELEDLLCSRFPTDAIEPVAKGELGADVIQQVNGSGGQPAGMLPSKFKPRRRNHRYRHSVLRSDRRAPLPASRTQ